MTNTTNTRLQLHALAWPVQVYYDASCRLCAAEMHNLRVRDQAGRLAFVDCSAPGFAGGPAPTAQPMRAMHCQDAFPGNTQAAHRQQPRWQPGSAACALARRRTRQSCRVLAHCRHEFGVNELIHRFMGRSIDDSVGFAWRQPLVPGPVAARWRRVAPAMACWGR